MNVASNSLSGLFADRYRIERAVGRGASATVYLAHDNKQDREIALKVLDNELANALGAKRFLQEIHIASRLQHPHILPIHDSGEWEGLLYYVLPFVAGESLRSKLDREKQLPVDECVQLTCDVASALAHAHSKGVIHRDIKPENILLSDGHALVADFGIARTIDAHTDERLTSSGLIVGTSQYMSPEQASGERQIDARSDIYSLGCVLYEMLAGIEPFVGPNVQAIIAQRFTHLPRPVTMFRPTVPENLERALNRSLAISPADRYQSMRDFARDLPVVAGTQADRRRPGRSLRDMARTNRGKVILVAAATFAAAFAAAVIPGTRGLTSMFDSRARLDSSLYVVIPPADPRGAARANEAGEALHQALSRWTGITVVQRVTVQNAIKKAGSPTDLDDATALAASLGAGKLVWGKVVDGETPGTKRYEFSLVDVRKDTAVREIAVSEDSAKLGSVIAIALLRDPSWPANVSAAEGHTMSLPALQSYGAGHAALHKWDLKKAIADFAAAARIDPEFADARVWNAQLQYWTATSDEWKRDATFAASRSAKLAGRDSTLALALGAIAGQRYPEACKEYRSLIANDSMNYLGWHGLGECLRRDETVVQSSRSPSGWEFRSSFDAAAKAMMRAVQVEPGAHAIIDFVVMQRLLAISPTRIRRGADGSGVPGFAAYPSLVGDTLAYIPYPLQVFSGLPFSVIRGRDGALDRNARELELFANSWISAYPKNADAYESLATVLEAQGNISPRIAGRRSASEALFQALNLATTASQRTRLMAAEVRLRIKRGEYADANRLADSLLSMAAARDSDEMIVVSGLVGRTRAFSRYAQRYDGWLPITQSQYTVPAELRVNASDLFARAALGECGSELPAIQAQIDHNIDSYITPDKRDPLRLILTSRSLTLLAPCTAGESALQLTHAETALQRAQQAFARKQFRVTRAVLDSLQRMRANSRPGDLSLDSYFQEAWLMANIGDSVAAAKHLDRALTALGAFSVAALKEPASAAALGRAIILRASLAARNGDISTANKWTDVVDKLYAGADRPLRQTVDDLKVLVRNARKH